MKLFDLQGVARRALQFAEKNYIPKVVAQTEMVEILRRSLDISEEKAVAVALDIVNASVFAALFDGKQEICIAEQITDALWREKA
jgi:hypothetical protein